jgi:hypothetical protein
LAGWRAGRSTLGIFGHHTVVTLNGTVSADTLVDSDVHRLC